MSQNKPSISRMIGGLSLFSRALTQGGDEVRTFTSRLRTLGTTESFRTVTKTMTNYLKQYDVGLRKNGREHIYTIKESINGQLELFKTTSEGTREMSRLFNISKNQLKDNLDNLSDFLRAKGFEIDDIDLNVVRANRKVSEFENVKDPEGLMKLLKASPIGSFIGKTFGSKPKPTLDNFDFWGERTHTGLGKVAKGFGKMALSPFGMFKPAESIEGGVKTRFGGVKKVLGSGAGDVAKGTLEAIALPFKTLKWGGEIAGKGLNVLGKGVSRLTGIPAEKLKAGANMFKSAAMPMLKGLAMGALLDIVMQLFDALNPFKPLMEALTTIFGVYGAILSEAFTPLIEKLFDVMLSDGVLAMIQSLSGAILQLVMAFLPLIDILGPILMIPLMIFVGGMQILATIIGAVSTPLQIVGVFFQNIVSWLSAIALNWNTYAKPIFDGIGTFFTVTIPGFFKSMINFVIGIINQGIGIFNGVIPGTQYDLATIPLLANGGIATKATPAIFGEAGPEAILPLDKLDSMLSNGGGKGVEIHIHGDITEDKLFSMRKDLLLNNIY